MKWIYFVTCLIVLSGCVIRPYHNHDGEHQYHHEGY
jgi:hypothetical protein